MFELESTTEFERRLERFARRHSELRQRIARILEDLSQDPFQPHLRLHGLSGPLQGVSAVWLNYQYRVTLTIDVEGKRVTVLNIGSHDEVYG